MALAFNMQVRSYDAIIFLGGLTGRVACDAVPPARVEEENVSDPVTLAVRRCRLSKEQATHQPLHDPQISLTVPAAQLFAASMRERSKEHLAHFSLRQQSDPCHHSPSRFSRAHVLCQPSSWNAEADEPLAAAHLRLHLGHPRGLRHHPRDGGVATA